MRLEQNYRSTQIILDAASALIRQNRNRKEKRLWTDQAGGQKVTCLRAGDDIEEADFIARTAKRGLGEADGRIAILYRTNAQSRTIEDALMREQPRLQDHRRRPASTSGRKSRTPSPSSAWC